MFERILVPLNGSAVAEQALPQAEALAQLMDAPLHLVRVIDPTYLRAPMGGVLHTDALALQLLLEEERIAAREYLERIEQDVHDRQHAVSVEYRQGPAAQELLAIMQPGDLLVMATHGRGGMARWFLGSVAETVVRRATVPVCLVRASDIAPRLSAIDRLVVPLDGSPLAEEALPTALSLAKRLQTPIHLITVIDVSGGAPMGLAAAAVSARRFEETVTRHFTDAQALLARPHERLQDEGVVTSVEVRHGLPGASIVDAVVPGDFIVMTSHCGTSSDREWPGGVLSHCRSPGSSSSSSRCGSIGAVTFRGESPPIRRSTDRTLINPKMPLRLISPSQFGQLRASQTPTMCDDSRYMRFALTWRADT